MNTDGQSNLENLLLSFNLKIALWSETPRTVLLISQGPFFKVYGQQPNFLQLLC